MQLRAPLFLLFPAMTRARPIRPIPILFEDSGASLLTPLADLRPTYDVVVGALTLREKYEHYLGLRITRTIVRDYLRDAEYLALGSLPVSGAVLLLNARAICDASLASAIKAMPVNTVLMKDATVVAAMCTVDLRTTVDDLNMQLPAIAALPATQTEAALIDRPWDVVRYFSTALRSDAGVIARRSKRGATSLRGVHVLKPKSLYKAQSSRVFPGVVINAEAGPVIICAGAQIMPNAYIEGPCVIRPHAVVKPHSSISNATIGMHCRVGGEIHTSTFHAYVNKQHEGFVGHSYFAPWVNLGAGTITSNLKNTYGTIRTVFEGMPSDTGMRFLGTIAGDHAKFGINTMLNTGTIVGVGGNVVGAGFPEKNIPPFQWDATGKRYEFEKFVIIARSVMARRDKQLTQHDEALLRVVYDRANRK